MEVPILGGPLAFLETAKPKRTKKQPNEVELDATEAKNLIIFLRQRRMSVQTVRTVFCDGQQEEHLLLSFGLA